MTRTERAVCATACVATMLLLWWSFSAPPGWALWVRIGAVLLAPVTFFGVLAAQLTRQTWREEATMTPEEIRERRRRAWSGGTSDTFPLTTRPWLYVRPLVALWELKKHTDPPRPPPPDR